MLSGEALLWTELSHGDPFYGIEILKDRLADFMLAEAEIAIAVVVDAEGDFAKVVKEFDTAIGKVEHYRCNKRHQAA